MYKSRGKIAALFFSLVRGMSAPHVLKKIHSDAQIFSASNFSAIFPSFLNRFY
jgi:hypothetical protein